MLASDAKRSFMATAKDGTCFLNRRAKWISLPLFSLTCSGVGKVRNLFVLVTDTFRKKSNFLTSEKMSIKYLLGNNTE